mmetsp:Transcript_102208/g.318368  ORF Transcript_102208/g.318368 Transcript_102208/m.318368 type:complete len:232 (+) Transcript_102208:936-1631(+)
MQPRGKAGHDALVRDLQRSLCPLAASLLEVVPQVPDAPEVFGRAAREAAVAPLVPPHDPAGEGGAAGHPLPPLDHLRGRLQGRHLLIGRLQDRHLAQQADGLLQVFHLQGARALGEGEDAPDGAGPERRPDRHRQAAPELRQQLVAHGVVLGAEAQLFLIVRGQRGIPIAVGLAEGDGHQSPEAASGMDCHHIHGVVELQGLPNPARQWMHEEASHCANQRGEASTRHVAT